MDRTVTEQKKDQKALALYKNAILRICYHVIAVYSENKLQHYAAAYRNHKSTGEKLGLFRFCTFVYVFFFSKYITACSEITF